MLVEDLVDMNLESREEKKVIINSELMKENQKSYLKQLTKDYDKKKGTGN